MVPVPYLVGGGLVALLGAAIVIKKKHDAANDADVQVVDSAGSAPDGVVTPERQAVYNVAMNSVPDPEKLKNLAAAFKKVQLPDMADALYQRALLRALPPGVKQQRREVFRKAMKSTNVSAIRGVAAALHGEGCTGAAAALTRYANGLKQ